MKVHFVNPNYYSELDEYMGIAEGWVESLHGEFNVMHPVHSGIGTVVEEKGGIVTKVSYTHINPDGKTFERIIDTTMFLITFVSKLSELVAAAKILWTSIFGSKSQKAVVKEIMTTRKELKNYNR